MGGVTDKVIWADWEARLKVEATIERSSEIFIDAVEQPETEVSVAKIAKEAARPEEIILTTRATVRSRCSVENHEVA